MDEADFWKLIDEARTAVQGDKYALVEHLVKSLAELPVEAVFEYDDILDNLLIKAHKRELWAAAIIIHGWCSEDCFAEFRAWLIAQGKEIFYKAVDDPNTLIDIADRIPFANYGRLASLEPLLYSANAAYLLKTGEEIWDVKEGLNIYPSPDGIDHVFDEVALRKEFPRLADRFLNSDQKPKTDN